MTRHRHSLKLTDRGGVHIHRWAPSCDGCDWVGIPGRRPFAVEQYRAHAKWGEGSTRSRSAGPRGQLAPGQVTPVSDLPQELRCVDLTPTPRCAHNVDMSTAPTITETLATFASGTDTITVHGESGNNGRTVFTVRQNGELVSQHHDKFVAAIFDEAAVAMAAALELVGWLHAVAPLDGIARAVANRED